MYLKALFLSNEVLILFALLWNRKFPKPPRDALATDRTLTVFYPQHRLSLTGLTEAYSHCGLGREKNFSEHYRPLLKITIGRASTLYKKAKFSLSNLTEKCSQERNTQCRR